MRHVVQNLRVRPAATGYLRGSLAWSSPIVPESRKMRIDTKNPSTAHLRIDSGSKDYTWYDVWNQNPLGQMGSRWTLVEMLNPPIHPRPPPPQASAAPYRGCWKLRPVSMLRSRLLNQIEGQLLRNLSSWLSAGFL